MMRSNFKLMDLSEIGHTSPQNTIFSKGHQETLKPRIYKDMYHQKD